MILNKYISAKMIVALILMRCFSASAQTFVSNNIKTTFFSYTPIEDISASSNKTFAVIVPKTGGFAFQVAIRSFEFERKLMQEHFNENYIESEKYPVSSFNGAIEPNISWDKNGDYYVVAKGIFTVHGVSKQRSIPAKISIREGVLSIGSSFDVTCVDHEIKIPTLVFKKIAKVINVKVNGKLTLKP